MTTKADNLQTMLALFKTNKVLCFSEIAQNINVAHRTVQRYLKQIPSLTSFTHRGKYITLTAIAQFDNDGLWFFSSVGFSKFGSSMDTIVELINRSEYGITKEELEQMLQIKISRQMQLLLEQNKLHRVKLANRYLYLPKDVMNNREKKIKIIAHRQTEEYHKEELTLGDTIAVLKVVLEEAKIELDNLAYLIDKYDLTIPIVKLQKLIVNYQLTEKKTP